MYFIRIESFVFSDLSHITKTLPVLKSSFLSECYFVLWLEFKLQHLQAVVKAAERQI